MGAGVAHSHWYFYNTIDRVWLAIELPRATLQHVRLSAVRALICLPSESSAVFPVLPAHWRGVRCPRGRALRQFPDLAAAIPASQVLTLAASYLH